MARGIAAPGKLAIVGWSYGDYAALQSGAVADRMIGQGDHVLAGSPARHAEAIRVPVLLFHGTRDQNVAVEQSRDMADRLRKAGKDVDYVEFKGQNHQLDSAAARTGLLSRSDAFLRRALGI